MLVLVLMVTSSAWATEGLLDLTEPAVDGISPVFLRTTGSDAIDQTDGVPEVLRELSGPLSPSRRSFELQQHMTFAMQDENADGVMESSAPESERKNPGRAVLLSALIPGAGQLYAESRWKAAAFFAVEMACWVGAIHFANEGAQKEEEYEDFADDLWDETIYREFEYWLATTHNPNAEDRFARSRSDWDALSWQEKIGYLPQYFTHELPASPDQQYYEMIGKYLRQFGIGWDDVHPDDPNQWNSWFETYKATIEELWGTGVSVSSSSPFASDYIDMRYDSNVMLDRSANFFMVMMANHVISALDAGFTVTRHNRRIATAELGARTIEYNNELVAAAGIHVRF